MMEILKEIVSNEGTFAMSAVFGTGIVVVVVVSVCSAIVNVVQIVSRDRLKHLMIERGMSPAEIKEVLQAGLRQPAEEGRKRDVGVRVKAGLG
jgi:hypothetical protein